MSKYTVILTRSNKETIKTKIKKTGWNRVQLKSILLFCYLIAPLHLTITLYLSDTRETGFVNAITAAGAAYAITRACTAGTLLECSCEKVRLPNT